MAEGSGTRTRWRDALVLTALTIFIVSGLLYYSRGLADEEPNDQATTSAVHDTAGPTETAADEPADPLATGTGEPPAPTEPSTSPATPTPPPVTPEPRVRTCWDGRATTSLRLCGLPEGARGLEYVFPTFAEDRPLCRPATTDADSYAVVLAFECFIEYGEGSVTVLYEQVADPEKVNAWMLQRLGRDGMREVRGSNGGRTAFTDNRNLPARYAVGYNRFPYLASVFASSPQSARRAFEQIVVMRPESRIRGRLL